MASKYFNIDLKPDIINGNVSCVIDSDKTDNVFAGEDILFDWQAVDIPRGTIALESIMVYMMGEDGGVQADKDFSFLFAKSINGVAPRSLGSVNGPQTACFGLPLHIIGAARMEGTSTSMIGPAFGQLYLWNAAGANGIQGPMIMTPEVISGTNVGYDKLYIAAFAGGSFDFSTGVLSDGGETSDVETSLTTKTVDPRKAFNEGDTVYIHDVNTAIGTIKSMTSTNITLNAVIADGTDIADEDEFMNATPITCRFGFRQ